MRQPAGVSQVDAAERANVDRKSEPGMARLEKKKKIPRPNSATILLIVAHHLGRRTPISLRYQPQLQSHRR